MMAKLWAALLMLGAAVEPAHTPLKLTAPMQDKTFYLLSAIERTPALREALPRDGGQRLDRAKSCGTDLDCYGEAFRWSEEQMTGAAHALSAAYRASSAVRAFTDGPLRASGMYVRYNDLDGPELLERAWRDCAHGMNVAIDVYGMGKPPRYPAIDAMTYDAKSDAFRRGVQSLAALMEEERASLDLFFAPSLKFAVELMFLNHRDEAGRFEPMEMGENAAAFRRVKSIEWSKYPYSVIVVPGAGNDRPGIRLSAGGKLRDEIAVKRFRENKAPFLLASGGFVHPERTEYSEAIEMKRDLMGRFGVPENAIIVDPHARHTTTNMRNAARLMYRYGIPFEKKALVTSDLSQSQYIEGATFEKRCLQELGYLPYKLLGRVSGFDLEFVPKIESLQADSVDLLDP